MKYAVRVLGMIVFTGLLVASAFAEVPRMMNYSGKLTEKNGNLVADAEYDMIFTLYDGQSGPQIWQESYNTTGNRVRVTRGAFNVVLGSTGNSLPATLDDAYLEMRFKEAAAPSYEIFPKQKLTSAFYAIRTENANNATNAAVANIANTAIVANSVTTSCSTAILPIGTILAWFGNPISGPGRLTGTPALPDGFLPCNGQQITDAKYAGTAYFGQWLPNLNGDPSGNNSPDFSSKERLFLRGGMSSGSGEADAFQEHRHNLAHGWESGTGTLLDHGTNLGPCANYNGTDTGSVRCGVADLDGGQGTPRRANETRPKSMSVIWIIKVK